MSVRGTATISLGLDGKEQVRQGFAEIAAEARKDMAEVGNAASSTTPRLDSLARAVGRLQREYNPLGAAAQKLARDEAMLDDALDKGKVSAEQHQAILGGLTARRTALNEAIRAATPEAKAAAAAEREAAEAAKRHAQAAAEEERALRSLMERVNPVGAAIRQVQADQVALAKAHAEGKISAADFATGSIQLDERLRQLGTTSRFTHTQMAILQSGVINTAQSIAAGLPTYQVLTTQLFQTAPAFAGMAAQALRVGGPLLAAAAAALIVGSRVAAMSSQSREFDTTLKALNPTIGATGERLRDLSFEIANLTGGSRSDATAAIKALVQNTALNGTNLLKPLSALSVEMAAVTGDEVAEMAKKLGDAMSKGAAGVRQLDDAYQFLTPKQREQVTLLEQQGRRSEALAIAVGALNQRFGGSVAGMRGEWGRAASEMGRAWDELVEKVANSGLVQMVGSVAAGIAKAARVTVAGYTDAERQAGAQAELPKLEEELAGLRGVSSSGAGGPVVETRIAQLEREIAALKITATGGNPSSGTGAAVSYGVQFGPDMPKDYLSPAAQKRIADRRNEIDLETAALKGNAQQRAANIAGMQAYQAVLARGGSVAEAEAMRDMERNKALREQAVALGDTTRAQRVALDMSEQVAAAWSISAVAVAQAEARKQAAVEAAGNSMINVQGRTQEILRERAIDAQGQLAATLDGAKAETAAAKSIAEAASLGTAAEREATAAAEAERVTRVALTAAMAEGSDARIADVLAMREQYKQFLLIQKAYEEEKRGRNTLAQRRDELVLLKQQGELIGQRPEIVARETAMLAERLRIQREGTQYEQDNIDAFVKSAGAIAQMSTEMAEFQRVATRTTDELTDAFVNAFDEATSGAEGFKNYFISMMKQLAANAIVRPIIQPIVTGVMNAAGMGGSAGTVGGAAAGGGGGLLGGLGQLGSLAGSANGLFGGNLFSGLSAGLDSLGASLGFASSSVLSVVPGSAAANMLAAEAAAIGAPASLGAAAPGLFGGMTLSGFLGGFGIGSGLAGLLGLGSGNMLIDTASGLGGAGLGAAIGSVIPGVGTLLGAIIGGFGGTALGGLFGKKKPSIPAADVIYRGTGNDFEVVREWTNGGGNIAPVLEAGGEIGSGFLKLIEQLGGTGFTGRGGEIGYFIGDNKKEGPYGGATLDGVAIGGGYHEADPEKLVANIYKDLLGNIDVAGLSDEVNAAIRKSASIRETLDEVVGDIAFAKSIYEDNPLNPEKLTPLEQSLKTLEEQFEELKKKAEELGIATGLVTEKYDEAKDALKQGFIKSIDDQLLALMDPQAFALQQFEESFADLRKQAEIAGVDLVKIEQLYALQRAEVLKQASGGVLDQLREFAVSLRAGPLSALTGDEQYGGLKATFEATAAQALTGDVTAMGRIQAESQAFLEASRAMFGATSGYAADWQRVTGIIDQLANDGAAPAGWESLAQAQQAANDALQQVAVINDMSLSYTKDIRDDTRMMRDDIKALRQANDRMASEIADLNRQLRARG